MITSIDAYFIVTVFVFNVCMASLHPHLGNLHLSTFITGITCINCISTLNTTLNIMTGIVVNKEEH